MLERTKCRGVRSNDIKARLRSETLSILYTVALFSTCNQMLSGLSYSHRSQYQLIKKSIQRGPVTAPTKRSTMARWMIKYVLFLCSRRCFTNIIMAMILRMTMAKHTVPSTPNHGMQWEAGRNIESSLFR